MASGIGQLLVELGDLRRQQQSFVDDGARRQRRNVEEAFVGQIGRGDFRFGALADHVELALQLVLGHPGRAANEDLLDVGLRRARHAADGVHIHRRVAPAEHGEAFFARDPLQNSFGQQAVRRLNRQKHHAHAVLARRRQRETQLGAFARKELVRNLNQNAGAVAGFRIAAAGAAMRQVDQDLQALDDDVVRLLALEY